MHSAMTLNACFLATRTLTTDSSCALGEGETPAPLSAIISDEGSSAGPTMPLSDPAPATGYAAPAHAEGVKR